MTPPQVTPLHRDALQKASRAEAQAGTTTPHLLPEVARPSLQAQNGGGWQRGCQKHKEYKDHAITGAQGPSPGRVRSSSVKLSESAGALPFHWAPHDRRCAGEQRAPRCLLTPGGSSGIPAPRPAPDLVCQSSYDSARCLQKGCDCDLASATSVATHYTA